MNIYFDTEFSGTEKKNGYRYLISIGCVSADGQEFYAELTDTWDENLCSMFTIENVLPLLQGGDCQMGVVELASRLKTWIESFNERVTFFRDAPHFDWAFFPEIFFHGWPSNLERNCQSVLEFNNDSEQSRYNAVIADFWNTNIDAGAHQHHALWDARSIRYAYEDAMRHQGMKNELE
jgi:hypothetical protein